MIKYFVGMFLLFALAGCGTYQAGKEVVTQAKQAVNDQQLEVSVQVLCNDVAVGAVRRKWNGDFTAWANFCGGSDIVVPKVE